jgi:hypothetical protein
MVHPSSEPRSVFWARMALAAAVLVLAAPAAQAQSPQPNSASVASVGTYPETWIRGYDVIVRVALKPGTEMSNLSLTYCRIQEFACAPSVPVTGTPETDYAAVLKWNASFILPTVRQVGLNVTLLTRQGEVERSPTAPWPERPQDVPSGTSNFYFVAVESSGATPSSKSPAAGLGALAAGVVAALWCNGAAARGRR